MTSTDDVGVPHQAAGRWVVHPRYLTPLPVECRRREDRVGGLRAATAVNGEGRKGILDPTVATSEDRPGWTVPRPLGAVLESDQQRCRGFQD